VHSAVDPAGGKDGSARGEGPPEERGPEQAWIAVVLAAVAGFVDAVGYLTLF
jgi:hypothetical protein